MNLRRRAARLVLALCTIAGSASAIACEADGLAGPGHGGFGFWSGMAMHRHHAPSAEATDDRAQASHAPTARSEAVLASDRRQADTAARRAAPDSRPAAER